MRARAEVSIVRCGIVRAMRASDSVEEDAVVAMVLVIALKLQMFHPLHRVAVLSIRKFSIFVSRGYLINSALNTELRLKTSR